MRKLLKESIKNLTSKQVKIEVANDYIKQLEYLKRVSKI